ncbi:MAG: HIT family protein [Gammaproteobacteria bacterium]|nr:HIT family protein [Gammaproteobacteria bacterium]
MSDFAVHPQLLADCALVGDALLCRVLLMNDQRFPWLILVPRLTGLRDFHEVPHEQRNSLYHEIDMASQTVKAMIDADKVNVAALGNQVSQLHVHVIGRLQTDAAWPGPVWGSGPAVPYDDAALSERQLVTRKAMAIAASS